MNFPADDPLYQGCQWNERSQNPALAEADLVLVIDSDVPWIPAVSRPPAEAAVFHIDVDPLKEETPLWYLPARQAFRADAATALRQLLAGLAGAAPDHDRIVARRARLQARFAQRQAALAARERPDGNAITAPFLMAALRRRADADTVVLNEGITNYTAVNDHMMRTRPGTLFTSGAGSLGWNGGAAIGVKLARPEATVFAIGGDGCYLFSQPSTVHWMARRYRTPFLQVVLNNAGWRAPRLSALSVHPDGWVRRSDDIGVSFQPLPDYAGIAVAAGGALGVTIGGADELEPALDAAMRAIHEEHRAAVLDVRLAG
jgi:acetolactate synthase-1/2/3 large subunit